MVVEGDQFDYVPLCELCGEIGIFYYDYLVIPKYFVGVCLMIHLTCYFIKSYTDKTLKIRKYPFYTTLFYFIFQILTMMSLGLWNRSMCHGFTFEAQSILFIIASNMAAAQTALLFPFLFYRLYKTYSGVPSMALSKFTIKLFTICNIAVCTFYLSANHYMITRPITMGLDHIALTLYRISTIMVILLAVALCFMYVYKMYGVYRKSQDADLMILIRKSSSLAFVSIFMTIITNVSLSLFPLFLFNMKYMISMDIARILDIYTNALCIFLAYKRFEKFYNCLCGCLDRRCMSKCVHHENKSKLELNTVISNSKEIVTNVKIDCNSKAENSMSRKF